MTARATIIHVDHRTIHADITAAPHLRGAEAVVTLRPWWRGGGIKVTLAGHSTHGTWVTETFTGYKGRRPPPQWFRGALDTMLAAHGGQS